MSNKQEGQNFLQGTAILAMATALVKIMGAVYKIPLNAIIGEQGFGYFNTAYEIYNILLMISTAGLPVAMSRMISQANSLENYNQVRRVYATVRRIFLSFGIVGSVLMTAFCRQLARFQNQPDAWAAIGFLGPCVLLICIISTFRIKELPVSLPPSPGISPAHALPLQTLHSLHFNIFLPLLSYIIIARQ